MLVMHTTAYYCILLLLMHSTTRYCATNALHYYMCTSSSRVLVVEEHLVLGRASSSKYSASTHTLVVYDIEEYVAIHVVHY